MGKKFLTTEQMYAIMKNNSNAQLREFKPDDVADGLAAAICHAHSLKFEENFRI